MEFNTCRGIFNKIKWTCFKSYMDTILENKMILEIKFHIHNSFAYLMMPLERMRSEDKSGQVS